MGYAHPMPTSLVEQLRELGMSGYEAKAYLAMLAAGRPLNGYEVAKESGVPRSTVYQTLTKLVERSAAFEVKLVDSPGTHYVALSAESLLSRVKREFDVTIDTLSRSLPLISATPQASLVHHIEGRRRAIEHAIDLIEQAEEELYVSAWPDEAEGLVPSLRKAERRGLRVVVMSFGELSESIGHHFVHQFSAPEVVLARTGARLLVVAADRRSVLIGGAVPDSMWAVWSDDPAVVLVAVEFVRHDIAMQALVERMGTSQVDEVWDNDVALQFLQTGRGAPGLERRRARTH